ncbi:hypothetical protein ARALYDRAFT_907679 [Arabidopsis lyrata subsp. lyrata]|uniref:Uncharacterized protein n=1 Tax=Arabidopsis lyrata subsp. lyrata TaxID=81972 RepID=D7LSA2_ARALL|nr:hypothetical protein ARALYDRAFT_907679 [Arabidopsis lyrata subsp. lyrata]
MMLLSSKGCVCYLLTAQLHHTSYFLCKSGSDAIKISREVDPKGRGYKLRYPWVDVVNWSQADINISVDMIAARRDFPRECLRQKTLTLPHKFQALLPLNSIFK